MFGNCSSLRTVIFPAELQKFSYSTFGNFLTVGKANAYFRGSRTDWAKISYVKDAKFKSVQYCYGEEDNSLITTQPVDTQYAVDGSASENPVKVTLKKPENGETYEISWVKTSSKEKQTVLWSARIQLYPRMEQRQRMYRIQRKQETSTTMQKS